MASMRKKKGNYYARFYDKRRSPKRKEVPLRTTRKDVARRRLSEMERGFERGTFDPWAPDSGPQKLPLREATEAFMQTRQHLRPKTIRAYDLAMRTLTGRVPAAILLTDVAERHLRPIIHDDSVSAATGRHRYRHLRTFFNWALKRAHIERSPLDGITPPKKADRVPEFLTPDQLARLLRCIDADAEMKRRENLLRGRQVVWLKDLILLAVGTGCRIGELTALRWQDVDFETGFLTIRNRSASEGDSGFQTKSGHERSIPLAGDALDVLRRLCAECEGEPRGYVLTGTGGGKLCQRYASKRFKYYVRLAKLPENIRFHSLRHTCASWLVQRGVSLPIVQAILGHSDVRVTQKYAHLAPDVMQAAMKQAFG